MSLKLTRQVWKMSMTPIEKFVLLALADHANDEGECWPSQATLADATGYSERRVKMAIAWLRENQLLTIEKTKKNKNTYRLSVGNVVHGNSVPVGNSIPLSGERGAPLVGNDVPLVGERGAPPYIVEPTNEPPIEPPKNHHSLCSSGDEPNEKAADAKDKKPKQKSEKKKPVYSPEVLILGERLAVCRTKDAGMKRTTPEAIEYYAGIVDTILNRGEVDHADMELVVGWFETPEGMESFKYGMGNIAKDYSHVLIRNLPQYLRHARGESPQPKLHTGFVRSGSHAPVSQGFDMDILGSEWDKGGES